MAYPYAYPGYGYNPQQTFMPQQQAQQPMQQPQMPQQAAQAFACHPVTSREEAVAAQTDYFSAGLVMPDLGHGMIYLKRFNPNTGASDFYEFKIIQGETAAPVQYVTRDEFDKFREEMLAAKKTVIKKKVEAVDDE